METSRTRAAWLDDGIVVAGNWEPLRGRLRSGSDCRGQARKTYEEEHSERAVCALRDAGVNLVITHFYKGFGAAAEREEMERTKAFTEICHKHGLKVGVYLQTVASIYYETFFHEVPEAKNWVSRDHEGRIPTYGAASYRYIPCPTCEPYLDYLEKNVLTHAVHEVKADLIHFDNFRWWPEPEACRCGRCAQRFREHLQRRWPDEEERFAHFGLKDFSFVKPPAFHALTPVWQIAYIRDPISQAWFDFKCDALAGLYKRFADFLRTLNSHIVVECNVDLKCGSNNGINRGAWPASVYPHGEIFWSERHIDRGISETGSIQSKIRNLKLAQATDNALLSYNYNRLSLAESMAFNRNCLGMISNISDVIAGKHEDTKPYVEFFWKNNDLFHPSESAAEVAVLYSYPTLTYRTDRPQLELVLAEQCLIEAHLPYDILFDGDLGNIGRYRAVVLPDVALMSDQTVTALQDYVHNGGGLLMTHLTAGESESAVRRKHNPFDDLLGISVTQQAADPAAQPIFREHGQGRLAHIPGLEPSVSPEPLPPSPVSFRARWFDNRWWKGPLNADVFTEALEWVANGFRLNVDAPTTLVVESRRQPAHNRLLLHLVNYNDQPVEEARCRIKAPVPEPHTELRMFSPDRGETWTCTLTRESATVLFPVRDIERYSIVEIPLGSNNP